MCDDHYQMTYQSVLRRERQIAVDEDVATFIARGLQCHEIGPVHMHN